MIPSRTECVCNIFTCGECKHDFESSLRTTLVRLHDTQVVFCAVNNNYNIQRCKLTNENTHIGQTWPSIHVESSKVLLCVRHEIFKISPQIAVMSIDWWTRNLIQFAIWVGINCVNFSTRCTGGTAEQIGEIHRLQFLFYAFCSVSTISVPQKRLNLLSRSVCHTTPFR